MNSQMNSDIKEPEENAASSTYSYTSNFFGNYLDNSQIDITHSDIQKSSCDVLDNTQLFIMQGRGMRQLMVIQRRIVLRQYVGRWVREKDQMKREQMRSPAYMNKVLLKLCMLINVKAKTKWHYFFVRAKKVAKERPPVSQRKPAVQQKQPTVVESPKQSMNQIVSTDQCEKQQATIQQLKEVKPIESTVVAVVSQIPPHVLRQMQRDRKMNSHIDVLQAFNKLTIIAGNLQTKYFHPALILRAFRQLKKQYLFEGKLQNIAQIINERQQSCVEFAWSQMLNCFNFTQKIAIFMDELKLLTHRQLRTAFLAIRHPHISNLIQISRIQQKQVKNEAPISISTENIFAELQIVHPNQGESKEQFLQHFASPFDLVTHEYNRQANTQHHADYEQIFARNHPKNLKFSRDVKKKHNTVSYLYGEHNQKKQSQAEHQKNTQKNVKTDLSQSNNNRSWKQSSNASMVNTSVVFKKTSVTLPTHLVKNTPVLCFLHDDMAAQMNDSAVNFCTISHSFRSRPNKTDDLQREITDFSTSIVIEDDQFFIRDMMNYYFAVCTQSNARDPRTADKNGQTQLKKMPKSSLQIINTSTKSPYRKETVKSGSKAIDTYQRSSTSNINTTHLKIPRPPPRFFDYYVQKPHKQYYQTKTTVKSLSMNRSSSFMLKRSPAPLAAQKSPKKLFKTLKSGNKTSYKSPQPHTHRPTQTNHEHKLSKGKSINEALVRGPNQEYMIEFGDPPKKKVRRNN